MLLKHDYIGLRSLVEMARLTADWGPSLGNLIPKPQLMWGKRCSETQFAGLLFCSFDIVL